MSPIASGSHPLTGVVLLPCSAGMAGSLANGISRGLAQRVADVALKQRWPLVIGIRETPMSSILLANLLTLARAGAHIVPPLPAFYLSPDDTSALRTFIDHYCVRLLDLLQIPSDREDLRWRG
jgi:4-hydroxy-3-polyprenylbenzoate decarboxylase